MDLTGIYESFGGDCATSANRLGGAERLEKYLLLFLQDTVMADLERTREEEDFDSMFRAAHTMKGNSDTLGLVKLHESAVTLTEALRAKDYSNVDALLDVVRNDYAEVETAVAAAQED